MVAKKNSNDIIMQGDVLPVQQTLVTAEPKSLSQTVPTPMHLLELALSNHAAIDIIERLAALQEKATLRDAEGSFNAAMSKVQGNIPQVAKDMRNPQTSSKYASYSAIDEAIRPLYTAEGISLSFDTDVSPLAEHIRVLCYATKGPFTKTYKVDMPVDGKGAKGGDVMTKTHATGSGMSYGQRYLVKFIFNLAIAGDDDDGNAAGNALVTVACPVCKKAGAIIKGKEQYGGGYVCFKKKGGCGEKFKTLPGEEVQAEPVEFAGTVESFKYPAKKNTVIGALKLKWTKGDREWFEVFSVTNPHINTVLAGSEGKTLKCTGELVEGEHKPYWHLITLLQMGKYDFTDPGSVQQYQADSAKHDNQAKQAEKKESPKPTASQAEPQAAPVRNGTPPTIEQIDVEQELGKSKKKTTARWFELEGIVIANSGVREAANHAQVVTIGIDALPDYRANPKGQHNRFDCYHKSLHAALSNAKPNSVIKFQYFPETTKEGKVVQYIESVLAIDDLRFHEGKIVQDDPLEDATLASPRNLF